MICECLRCIWCGSCSPDEDKNTDGCPYLDTGEPDEKDYSEILRENAEEYETLVREQDE